MLLFPEVVHGRAAARTLADTVASALRELVPITDLSYTVSYDRVGTSQAASVDLTLSLTGDGVAASRRSRTRSTRGGTTATTRAGSRYWHQSYANKGTVFLVAEVENAVIELAPWSTLSRRPEAERQPDVENPQWEQDLAELQERSERLSEEYGPGLYLSDPSDLIAAEDTLRCTECGRLARNDEDGMEQWPGPDENSELEPFCPECAGNQSPGLGP